MSDITLTEAKVYPDYFTDRHLSKYPRYALFVDDKRVTEWAICSGVRDSRAHFELKIESEFSGQVQLRAHPDDRALLAYVNVGSCAYTGLEKGDTIHLSVGA